MQCSLCLNQSRPKRRFEEEEDERRMRTRNVRNTSMSWLRVIVLSRVKASAAGYVVSL